MDQITPIELTLLLLRIRDFLQKRAYIRRMGKKKDFDNEKGIIWRLSVDISVYREPVR